METKRPKPKRQSRPKPEQEVDFRGSFNHPKLSDECMNSTLCPLIGPRCKHSVITEQVDIHWLCYSSQQTLSPQYLSRVPINSWGNPVLTHGSFSHSSLISHFSPTSHFLSTSHFSVIILSEVCCILSRVSSSLIFFGVRQQTLRHCSSLTFSSYECPAALAPR